LFELCARATANVFVMRTRDETRDWVHAVLTHLDMKPTQLAKKIGKAPSTLNRFLNDPDVEHNLSDETLRAIAEVAKVRPFEVPGGTPRRAMGMGEAEAVPFEAGKPGSSSLVGNALAQDALSSNGRAPWILRSTALTGVGYLPGDVLIVDLNERPRVHDVVCAQVYDWSRGKAETVFRLYEPPYLLSSTTDPKLLRPLVVDDDVVIVKGVVVSSMRNRRATDKAA
jgi:hypothetical protein